MTRKYIGTKILTAYPVTPDDPRGDGYAVIYADGYQSFSPRAVFEEAYRAIEGNGQALTFGDALHMLKLGKKVARAGWNGVGLWLEFVSPLASCDLPFIRMSYPVNSKAYPEGARVPWLASQTDMLASDWMVVP